MEIKLRPYQKKAATLAVSDVLKGHDPLVALPTGAGKTFTMAAIIKSLQAKGNDHFLVLTHVKEIIQQNQRAIEAALGEHVSVYSAGLDKKQIGKITVAGIQSAYNKPQLFEHFNVIIIDEAHLISKKNESMYQKFFKAIGEHTKIGLTATPFRLGDGYIYGEDMLFDKLSYDCTTGSEFTNLVDDGYLSPIITRGTETKLETEGVATIGGDFSERQLAAANDLQHITNKCIDEILKRAGNRKKWLIFAIDIDHAEHIAEGLIRSGIPTAVVHSKMDADRDQVVRRFRDGDYRCIVNVNILTTGFDVPSIDLIALLRPTKSPVLHVQTIGRGMRINAGKLDCLVLDFAGNISRLGPINDVSIIKKKKGGEGSPMVKECPDCYMLTHIKTKHCPDCGHEFKFKILLSGKPGTVNPVVMPKNNMLWLPVSSVQYDRNRKAWGPDSVIVSYEVEDQFVHEWWCVEHEGYAGWKAAEVMEKAGGVKYGSVKETLDNRNSFKCPRKILVDLSGKYPEVKERVY